MVCVAMHESGSPAPTPCCLDLRTFWFTPWSLYTKLSFCIRVKVVCCSILGTKLLMSTTFHPQMDGVFKRHTDCCVIVPSNTWCICACLCEGLFWINLVESHCKSQWTNHSVFQWPKLSNHPARSWRKGSQWWWLMV